MKPFQISDFGLQIGFTLLPSSASPGPKSAICNLQSEILAALLTLSAFCSAAAPQSHPIPRPDAAAPGAALAPLPPFVAAPQFQPAKPIVPIPIRPWLPRAIGPDAPRLLPADRQGRAPLRPAVDLPELAAVRPPLRRLVTGAAAYAEAPDPAEVVAIKIGPEAAPSAPTKPAVPPATPVHSPRRVATDAPQAVRSRPALDTPPLAWERDPFTPRAPRMATVPLAFRSSLDPTHEPMASRAFLPLPDRASLRDDPTWENSRQAATARSPELARPVAPFLRLVIPDPFETIALVQLRRPLPDDDPPSRAPGLPPRPTLPVNP